jgi:translation initiation factor IF-3
VSADQFRVNDRIRARLVRVISSDGSMLGVKALSEALTMARESGLDLVEVAPDFDPPVCKIMDFRPYAHPES